ncbi:MAG: GNAT family N-acetyltransferase [Hyphomicrobiaceae bacterium]
MSNHRDWGGMSRKLWPSESSRFRDHLLRLDLESRRLRFAHSVSDDFIRDYADRMSHMGSIVYAYQVDGAVVAAAELRKLADEWGDEAEAAFSVERAYQDRGIGTELMGFVIRSARNRGVRRLYLSCLAENRKMQAIARKHQAELHFERGEVMGEIVPVDATYFSIVGEAVDDRFGLMLAVLDLTRKVSRAA